MFSKKHFILLFFLAVSAVTAFSNDDITISSRFEDGHFVSHCKVKVDVSDAVAHKLVDDFIRQSKYHLDSLFMWALKDLKLQGEKGELLVFNLKSGKYDSKSNVVHGKMDVSVPGIYTIDDFSVDTRTTKTVAENGQITMFFEVTEAAAFVKTTTATLKIVRIDEKTAICTMNSRMSFGWFFNIFITQKRYKEMAEWRFKQLMVNLKKTAEKTSKE